MASVFYHTSLGPGRHFLVSAEDSPIRDSFSFLEINGIPYIEFPKIRGTRFGVPIIRTVVL